MATSDPNISLLPQPSQPAPIEPMRGGGTEAVTNPNISLLPQPSVAAPIEPMRGGGDQVGNPSVSLLPQPASPAPVEPMKGGAGRGFPSSVKITEGIFQYRIRDFSLDVPQIPDPPFLDKRTVKAYIYRREAIWKQQSQLEYRPPSLDPKPTEKDQEGFLNYFLTQRDQLRLFFVNTYTEFVYIRKFIQLDYATNKKKTSDVSPERFIYILFCNAENSQIYSDIFRGLVAAVSDIPSRHGDIFLISDRTKMHIFQGTKYESESLDLLNRKIEKQSIPNSRAKIRVSYEPSVITRPITTNQLFTIKLAFSAEKLSPLVYNYFGLEQQYTINLFGVQFFNKDEETTLYFNTKSNKKFLSNLKPGENYEIKHFKYNTVIGKYVNLFEKSYITFITNEKPDTPFSKIQKQITQPAVQIQAEDTENNIENNAEENAEENAEKNAEENDEDSQENQNDDNYVSSRSRIIQYETLPSGKRRMLLKFVTNSEDNTKDDQNIAEQSFQMREDMKIFRKKLRDAITDTSPDNKLITINLNGILYKIRPYSTSAWADWGELDLNEGEENLIKAIGIYEPLIKEKSKKDFYHSNIQSFFKDLGTYACFREDHLLLKYECNNIKEFLQKHYELLLKSHIDYLGKYSLGDFKAFNLKGVYDEVPPPPAPGSGPSTSIIKKGGPGAGAVAAPGPGTWSSPFTPDELLEFIKKLTPLSLRFSAGSLLFFPIHTHGTPLPPPPPSSSSTGTTSPTPSGPSSWSTDNALLLLANQLGLLLPLRKPTSKSIIPGFII